MANNWKEDARCYWRPLIDGRFYPTDKTRLERIDSELDVLFLEMKARALRLRNECTFTCSLPSEILTNIFLFLRDEWPPEREGFYDPPSTTFRSGWMTVTHICSKWREVAVGAPNLWTKHLDVLSTPLQYIPAIVARSKACLLDLRTEYMTLDEPNDLCGWLCPSVCRRVRRLHMEGLTIENFGRLLPGISPYLTRLQVLYLEHDGDGEGEIELPPELCNATHITDLTLKGFCLPWMAPVFSARMTHLEILISGVDSAIQPTSAQFEDFCASMPSLQSLKLGNVVPLDHSDDVIFMPAKLQKFEFNSYRGAHNVPFLHVLPLLRFPGACQRAATIVDYANDGVPVPLHEPAQRCIEAFSTFDEETQAGPMELYYDYNQIIALQSEHTTRSLTIPLSMYGVDLSSETWKARGLCSRLRIDDAPFDDLIPSMRLNNLRAITIFAAQRIRLGTLFGQLVACAPSIHRIELWLTHTMQVLDALMDVAHGDSPPFLRLDTLVLHGVYESDDAESKLCAHLTALTAFVGLRKSEGRPLAEIFVSKCTEPWGVWDALKGDVQITFL